MSDRPLVAVIMGSYTDWGQMEPCVTTLNLLGIPNEYCVVSAHRTPKWMVEYAEGLDESGVEVVIAGAGGAAHLPGDVAALTEVPVIGVPIKTSFVDGLDSLLSILQMPPGVPVATMAVGEKGAKNAAVYAAAMLRSGHPAIKAALSEFRRRQTEDVMANRDPKKKWDEEQAKKLEKGQPS